MQKNPSFRQIEAFRAVILTGSISGGAALLGLTQPAVSRLVRDLEYRIGLTLFTRSGNSVRANAEAQQLYREVEQQFVGLEQIGRALRDIKEAQLGSIRIAAFTGATTRFLPRLIACYLDNHVDARVTLMGGSSAMVVQDTALRRFDLGLAHVPSDYPSIDAEELHGLYAACAVPTDHPLAKGEAVRIADLHSVPLLSLGQTSPIWALLSALLNSRGISPKVVVEANVSDALCTLVGLKRGIGIIDPFSAAELKWPGVILKPLDPPLPYPISLVFQKSYPRSGMVESFAQLIRDEVEQMAKNWEQGVT